MVGCVAFAALFASSMATAEKLFFGAALLLLAGFHDGKVMTEFIQDEGKSRITLLQFLTLERSLKGEPVDWNVVLEKNQWRERFHAQLDGNGLYEVLVLVRRYLIWIGVGWLTGSPTALELIRAIAK